MVYCYMLYVSYFQFIISFWVLVLYIIFEIREKYLQNVQSKTKIWIWLVGGVIVFSLVFLVLDNIFWHLKYHGAPQKKQMDWPQKKQQIKDSLAFCGTLQDSIICLNSFAHRDVFRGTGESYIEHFESGNSYLSWGVEVFWHYFSAGKLTVNCAGNAAYASALYREFMERELDVYRYFIGMPDDPQERGHVINLLVFKEGTEERYYLMDPSFNSYYSGKDGMMMDLREMLTSKGGAGHKNIVLVYTPEKIKYMSSRDFIRWTSNPLYDGKSEVRVWKNGAADPAFIFSFERTVENYLKSGFSEDFKEISVHYGIHWDWQDSADFAASFLFMYKLDGGKENDKMTRKLKEWIGNEIELYKTVK